MRIQAVRQVKQKVLKGDREGSINPSAVFKMGWRGQS